MQTDTAPARQKGKGNEFPKIALKYARDVVSGKTVACKYTVKACQRYLDDIDAGAWKLDKEKIGRVCRFMELLPHIKGSKALTKLKLEPWQVFILANIFGWVDKSTGLRRFNRAITFVGRGNGKSFLASGIGLYCAFFDHEPGSDVFSLATTREQAKLVWSTAQAMMRAMPDLREKAGIEVEQHSIFQKESNSSFRALSADYGSLDGLIPQLAIIDELHAVTRGLWDIVETALSKRSQPLLLSISTAGFDSSSIGYEMATYVRQILDGVVKDDKFFGIIFEADKEALDDRNEWVKANPNMGVSVVESSIAEMAKKAMHLSSFRSAFITRHLNRWVNSRSAWLKMEKWDAAADPEMRPEDFASDPLYIGLDLSSRSDITAKCRLFKIDGPDGKAHFRAFFTLWLPEAAVEESRNASYAGWVHDGHIQVIPGDTISFNEIQESVIEDARSTPGFKEVLYDPWSALQLAQNLEASGIVAIEVRPTRQAFSPAMKELEAAILDGRFKHDGNPAVRWCMGNITVRPDAAGNIYPAKPEGTAKIDPGVALIAALSRAYLVDDSCPYSATRGLVTV